MRKVSVLKKGIEYYFGSTNTIEHIYLDIIAWIADRPEGNKLTNTRKEGTYGKVNGWAVNVSEEHLPDCKNMLCLVDKKAGASGRRNSAFVQKVHQLEFGQGREWYGSGPVHE